jgi:hypothetical protein
MNTRITPTTHLDATPETDRANLGEALPERLDALVSNATVVDVDAAATEAAR